MTHRSVVEERRFTDELALIEPDVRRSDEALFYVKELLARQPSVGLATSTPGILVAPIILPVADGSGWSIYYVVRPNAVHLLSVTLD
jgi:hypothetical protein